MCVCVCVCVWLKWGAVLGRGKIEHSSIVCVMCMSLNILIPTISPPHPHTHTHQHIHTRTHTQTHTHTHTRTGIIDFLQGWTGGKKCAHVIKYLLLAAGEEDGRTQRKREREMEVGMGEEEERGEEVGLLLFVRWMG